jgi:Domain of unknown function (DUF4114)/PEP-CTERM motif
MNNLMKSLGLAMLTLLFLAGSASALSTYVNPKGEWSSSITLSMTSPGGILDRIYGLNNLTRVDDSADQIWQLCPGAGCGTATYEAKYAGYDQYFGFSAIDGTGKISILDSVSGTLNTTYTFTPSGQFVFYDDPYNNPSPIWYSLMSLNGGDDHMVTWKINSTDCDYVIAFEDLPLGSSDQDYNDLVIEVKNVGPVPEPATMLLLGLGLLGVAGIRRKIK